VRALAIFPNQSPHEIQAKLITLDPPHPPFFKLSSCRCCSATGAVHASKDTALDHQKKKEKSTFKSILNEYGKGGEVLGLVVSYSGEASSDVHRVADLVATRLALKYLEYLRTSKSIAKAMRTQRICRAWVHSFARGFARVILDRVRDNLD
jgi:hypothetical protein